MENIIPLNGRIAIVDDKVEQALPLMRVLSKNNIPYIYYQGNDMNFLPKQPENDIRILFLDLNLIGGRDNQPKDIKASLYPVIKKIISPNNYPYVLILWSRQENEYKKILEDLFKGDLKQCAPISIANYVKSDFFPNFAEEEENNENEDKIIEELKKILATQPAYSYLMQWENCIHNSANETIQNVFHDFHSENNWTNNANCIMNMFAKSYLEKYYESSLAENRAKASLLFLNDVYHDTLESSITNTDFSNAVYLSCDKNDEEKKDIAAKINKSLLLSEHYDSCRQPGCVLRFDSSDECSKLSHEIFNNSFVRNKLSTAECKKLKEEIYTYLTPCEVVVTPACDYAQDKLKNDRIVRGIIIDAKYFPHIDSRSEAIYISPQFTYLSRCCIMVLNFRYFVTRNLEDTDARETILFRLRNTLLAEIQSKLARHINRQGIMNL